MSEVRVVFCTCPDVETAERLAQCVVEERLAACVNLVPGLRSVYKWEGEIHRDSEVLLLIKTTAARLPALTERLVALHPYSVPEVIATPVIAGAEPYLAWVESTCV